MSLNRKINQIRKTKSILKGNFYVPITLNNPINITMYYLIYSEDVENSLPLRQQARPAHLERLTALKQEGRLLVAGPCPAIDAEDPAEAGFTGSMVVAEFDNLASAKAWADDDPYIAAGVYKSTIVKPYKKVLP